jgi:hypothetical protein
MVDIKGTGGYVMIPPSIHPSGPAYGAMNDAPIIEIDELAQVLPDAPASPKPRARATVQVANISKLWPTTPVEDVLAGVSILSLLPGAEQTGPHWYMVKCPFHDDHAPSMWVDTGRGICGCYAGCTQKPLDVIDLYARLTGLTTKQAIKELKGKAA